MNTRTRVLPHWCLTLNPIPYGISIPAMLRSDRFTFFIHTYRAVHTDFGMGGSLFLKKIGNPFIRKVKA